MQKIKVLGAGLAGCEAAWHLSQRGFQVELYEMKPIKKSPAHKSENFAELVCSNSLKAARIDSAAGLLKAEMRIFGSLCLEAADMSSVAAGGALAVDRNIFSEIITEKIKACPNIEIITEVVEALPQDGYTIVATGPLTDEALANDIKNKLNFNSLYFYDAASPIVTAESIDMTKAFFASRYGKGTDDYINCPMNKAEYEAFYQELINAESVELKEFEQDLKVYEGCMPVEVLAKRGEDSIRFGPLKPVGLIDPNTNHRPWANVQLRRENTDGTLYNLVGFQTNLKFPEQKRVFSMIPGLENADFVRYGVMHRNTFINSPELLSRDLSLKQNPNLYFAGQITGVEGYMESAASGILAAYNLANKLENKAPANLPNITMLGSLTNYICTAESKNFQPMGANFGILPPLETKIKDKRERYQALAERSLAWFKENEI